MTDHRRWRTRRTLSGWLLAFAIVAAAVLIWAALVLLILLILGVWP